MALIWNNWQQGKLQQRLQAQLLEHQAKLERDKDARKLRDERHSRLRQDLDDLIQAVFLLHGYTELAQWGDQLKDEAAVAKKKELVTEAGKRLEEARARLALDDDGLRLLETTQQLSRDVERFESRILTLAEMHRHGGYEPNTIIKWGQDNEALWKSIRENGDAIKARAREVLAAIVQPIG